MNAEQLLELLARKELIAPHLLEAFRKEIAGRAETTSASEMAQTLVNYNVLTRPQAEIVLQQLERQYTVAPSVLSAPPPLGGVYTDDRQGRSTSPPPALKKEPMLPQNPQSAPPVSGSNREQLFPTARRDDRVRFSRKKTSSNPWDSKLILFGAAGLLVLFLLGFFLVGSLFRRSAEAMFAKADDAYRSGSYSEAIIGYTEFLDAYPSHTESSAAKIRRALARIRVLVDAKTDWSQSLKTAETELRAIEKEPRFFEESNAELGNLLPAIAVGLAEEAREKISIQHAEQTEKTLKLIDEYLPRSLRPVDKLAEVQYRIDEVRRRLVQSDILHEAKLDLEQKLAAPKFDARQVELCYDLVELILADHPALQNDPGLIEMLQSISAHEHRAVMPLPEDQLPRAILSPEEKTASAVEAAIPLQRTLRKTVAPEDGDPVFLAAEGAVYGIKATDATPLWKRHIGGGAATVSFFPLPKTMRHPSRGVVLVNTAEQALDQRDELTGKLLWRLPIGESFYPSPLAADAEQACLGIATRSGKLITVVFAGEGNDVRNEVRGVQLPQHLASAPFVDFTTGVIYQFAEKNTLYTVLLEMSEECGSRYFGQKPSAIRVAPLRFGDHLIVIRQQSTDSCELDVFSPEKGVVQAIPLRGLVDTRPAVDDRFLALTTDSGETCLFEQTDDTKTPLRMIAQGSAGARQQGTVRYAVLAGQNVWIADRQLMRFEPQLVQSRLLPQAAVRKDIVTIAPPLRRNNVLFHAFRQPGFGGVFLQAVSMDSASILWEVELADPIVLEPRRAEKGFRVFTSAGNAYPIDPENDNGRFLETTAVQLPRGVFGSVPLGAVVDLGDGFEVWTPRLSPGSSNRTVMIDDAAAAEATRFRPATLPAPLSTRPTALDGKLLATLTDGQIVLLDPKSGRFAADPFTASLSPEKPSVWGRPALVGPREFVVYDNTPDSRGGFALYRVELEGSGGNIKFAQKEKISMDAPGASSIAVLDRSAMFLDRSHQLRFYRLGQDDAASKPETPEPIGKPCVWGPFAVGKTVLFATPDGRLHAVNDHLKRISQTSPIPVGEPLVESDGIVLTNDAGKLWKINPSELKTIFSIETGVRTSVGPFRNGNDYFIAGRDGTVYRIDENNKN